VQFKISADKTIGAVDQAGLEIAVKTKFSEFGVVLRADPLRKLFKPKHKRALPDIGGSELPLETIGNLRAVADNCNVTIRYNVIKKEDEILIPDAGWSIDNGKTASITWLQSECHKVEMRTANIKNFVTLLADSNQFNPVTEWINSKQWDGVSRIDAFYDTVQEDTDKCSAKMKRIVMLRWAVSAIAAAFSPNGIMARGVLVFQGVQYSGKTRWIDALAPKDMELIKTGRALNVHDKDSVKQIVSSWISELGELDATFKKSDIAALKAFITSDTDELRRPYAAAESRYARRTVFAASVNESKFLQDDTGNSRFWVIPIVSINHAHELDMQQVWAEFYVLWKGGEKHYLTNSEMTMLNGHNESFTAPEPIFEMVSSHLDWANFDPNDCRWMQTSDVLRWIGKENPSKFETIVGGRAIQKMNGGMQRKSHGKLLSAVPNEKLSIEVHNFDKLGNTSSEGGYESIPF
jgi:putative DNA primase/helicase